MQRKDSCRALDETMQVWRVTSDEPVKCGGGLDGDGVEDFYDSVKGMDIVMRKKWPMDQIA